MSYLGVLVILSLLIVVHEAGHLLAAKLVGIPVAGFSVGFGPKLWARRWRGVEYSLRALPLGGFVVPAMEEDELREVLLGKRLVFFLGGPIANLVASLPLFGLWSSLEYGPSLYRLFVAPFGQVMTACSQFLGMLSNARPESFSGVVGIIVEGGRMSAAGMALELALSLSISLAVLNLLPIPVLDGGQIVMSCLEQAFPRLIRLRAPLTVLGVILLVGLMAYTNVQDMVRYLGA
jgi:regulator of sigma E protease